MYNPCFKLTKCLTQSSQVKYLSVFSLHSISQQKKQHQTNEEIVNSKIEFLKLSCINITLRIEPNTKIFCIEKVEFAKVTLWVTLTSYDKFAYVGLMLILSVP